MDPHGRGRAVRARRRGDVRRVDRRSDPQRDRLALAEARRRPLRQPKAPGQARFNAGQKIVFWGVVLGAVALLASGLTLMFPFYWLGMDGMQWTQLIHAAVGLAMIALIIGHIYIGTIGMKGLQRDVDGRGRSDLGEGAPRPLVRGADRGARGR